MVLTVPVTLQAGQTRLISDQLTVTVTRDDAEVENFVECIDPAGDRDAGVNAGGRPEAFNAGTNYSRGRGQLAMHGSLLFTAPHTGTFLCQVRAHTNAGKDFKYHLTAVAAPRPGGTWLAIDNFTGDAPLWWQINTCQLNGRAPTGGTDPNCVFLGRPLGSHGHPVTATLHGWPPFDPGHPGCAPERPVGRPAGRDQGQHGRPHADHLLLPRHGILPRAANRARRISGPGAW